MPDTFFELQLWGVKGVLVAVLMDEAAIDSNPLSPPGQFASVVLCVLKLDVIRVCAMRTCVVVLSSYLLFAQGIVSRLWQHLRMVDLELRYPRQPDAMAQIAAVQPSVVILDRTDSETTQFCSPSQLLDPLPELRIICLDPEHDQAQVVISEPCPMVKVGDLVEVIDRLA